MTQLTSDEKIQPHWWSKTFSGLFLGLALRANGFNFII